MHHLTTVERAFEIAREGRCRDRSDIGRQLSAEGYSSVSPHLAGSSIRKQLFALLRKGRDDQPRPTGTSTPS